VEQSAVHAQCFVSAYGVDVSASGGGRYAEAIGDLAYGHGTTPAQRRGDPSVPLRG
jgi:hypothetical protein